jgi:DNA-binding NarL/FixJ family response regulator/class 3 adenylate cyclase
MNAPDLPEGRVTFFFADLEDSTGLARQLGDAFAPVLDDSRRIIRRAIAENGGWEVDCYGDEVFAVFTSPPAAVEASLTVQDAFHAYVWPESTTVRVRIGILEGEGRMAGMGYVGLDVHRASRITEAGHGGQVLLSAAAAEKAHAPVRDLGVYVLDGLAEPEHIFQLLPEQFPAEFPSLRSGRKTDERTLRIVLADDSVLLREGIARLLEDAGMEVAAQAGTADDLRRYVGLRKPDVAIVDIRMPPTYTDEGLQTAHEIRRRFPGVAVLVLSQYVEPAYAMELLADDAEGVGYLLKDRVSDVDEFVAAVRRVATGGSALDPAIVSQLIGRRRREDPLERLTPREREVLELMAEGRSNQAIAERLYVTMRAVEKHVTSIFTKLGLTATDQDHRRVLAVLTYLHSEGSATTLQDSAAQL